MNLKKFFKISEQEKVLEAIIKSSFLNLIAKGFGYFKHVAIAVFLGFSFKTDAYFMALSLIGIFLIFTDVFDSIGVPNLVKARLKNQQEFQKLSGLLFTFTLILALIVSFLAFILYPFILKIPKGFSSQTLYYTKIAYFLLIPYLILNFIFRHFGAVLRSLRRFTYYFIGEFLLSFFSFLFIVTGLLIYKTWIVLPLSISLAQMIATLYILYIGREFIHTRFYIDKTTKKILSHFFYLSALYGVFHLFVVADRAFASLLKEKSVSALSYGLIIASIPRGVLKLEHMAITSLSEVDGSLEKLSFYIKKVLMFTLPLSLIFFVFAGVIVKFLFGYGAFSKTDVLLTAKAVRFYSLSLPFMFLWPIFYRVFQIKENLKPVFFVAIAGIVTNILLNYLFVVKLKYGITGICLGTFGAYISLCGISYLILRRKVYG